MDYIQNSYKLTNGELAQKLDNLENDPTWEHLLMIDWVHHHHDGNYDGGLSFFDRLNKKLSYKPRNWDIEGYKRIVRGSNDPPTVYIDILKYLLEDPQDITVYGL